jgi:hypothetical protein
MPNYQPIQNLTWKYSTGTGQLSVVSTITISLAPGEFVTGSASPISGGVSNITLTVTNVSSLFPPIVIPYVVQAGYTTKEQVRAYIKSLNPVTVIATCYKNGQKVGENSTGSQTNSEIDIVA